MILDYEQFKETVTNEVKNVLPDDCEVRLGQVIKLNGQKLESISAAGKDAEICETHYFEQLYQIYKDGADIEVIVKIIMNSCNSGIGSVPKEFESLTVFEQIRDNIYYKLINYAVNEEMLKDIPHERFLDLAVVYSVMLYHGFDSYQVMVNDKLLECWGIKIDEMRETARENTRRDNPPVVCQVKEFLIQHMSLLGYEDIPEGGEEMLSVSGRMGNYGAIYMMDQDVLKEIAQCFNEDLYVIPSSIHEIITIPVSAIDREHLDEIIKSVNENELAPGEYLSDHAYRFSLEEGRVL